MNNHRSELSGMPHAAHWPAALPWHLTLPETNVFHNAEVSALRYPNKPFIVFYDSPISFARFHDEAERIAGFLQQRCGVKAGSSPPSRTSSGPRPRRARPRAWPRSIPCIP